MSSLGGTKFLCHRPGSQGGVKTRQHEAARWQMSWAGKTGSCATSCQRHGKTFSAVCIRGMGKETEVPDFWAPVHLPPLSPERRQPGLNTPPCSGAGRKQASGEPFPSGNAGPVDLGRREQETGREEGVCVSRARDNTPRTNWRLPCSWHGGPRSVFKGRVTPQQLG